MFYSMIPKLETLFTTKFFFCRHRHYIPPDPPGYFDFVVWPMYLKNKEELANIRDIGRFLTEVSQVLFYFLPQLNNETVILNFMSAILNKEEANSSK